MAASGYASTSDRHHQQHHDGIICISGTGGAIRVVHADGRPYGAAPPSATSMPRAPAAPRSLSSVAADATAALGRLGRRTPRPPSLEQLITAALRESGRART
jgi:hypothetical protein